MQIKRIWVNDMDVEKPRPKTNMKCPLWRKPMKEVCHQCEWWVHVRGKHPQSEEIIDSWNCAITWLPVLMIENSQQQRQTGAAVESFRNEMVKLNGRPPDALISHRK